MTVIVICVWVIVTYLSLRKIGQHICQHTTTTTKFTDFGNNFENQDKVILISDRGRKNTVIGTGPRVFPLLDKFDSDQNTIRSFISDKLSFR